MGSKQKIAMGCPQCRRSSGSSRRLSGRLRASIWARVGQEVAADAEAQRWARAKRATTAIWRSHLKDHLGKELPYG